MPGLCARARLGAQQARGSNQSAQAELRWLRQAHAPRIFRCGGTDAVDSGLQQNSVRLQKLLFSAFGSPNQTRFSEAPGRCEEGVGARLADASLAFLARWPGLGNRRPDER